MFSWNDESKRKTFQRYSDSLAKLFQDFEKLGKRRGRCKMYPVILCTNTLSPPARCGNKKSFPSGSLVILSLIRAVFSSVFPLFPDSFREWFSGEAKLRVVPLSLRPAAPQELKLRREFSYAFDVGGECVCFFSSPSSSWCVSSSLFSFSSSRYFFFFFYHFLHSDCISFFALNLFYKCRINTLFTSPSMTFIVHFLFSSPVVARLVLFFFWWILLSFSHEITSSDNSYYFMWKSLLGKDFRVFLYSFCFLSTFIYHVF